jgi:hypothetical protein
MYIFQGSRRQIHVGYQFSCCFLGMPTKGKSVLRIKFEMLIVIVSKVAGVGSIADYE